MPFLQPGHHAAPAPQINAPSPLWAQRVPPLLAQRAGPLLSCCPILRSQRYLWRLMVRFCLGQHLLVPPGPLLLLVVSRRLIMAPPVVPFAPSYLLPRCLRFCPGVLRVLARHAAAHRSARGHPVLLWIRDLDAAVLRPQFVGQLAASFLLPPLLFQRARSRHARRGPVFSVCLMGCRLRLVSHALRLPSALCLVVSEVLTSFLLPPCPCCAVRLAGAPAFWFGVVFMLVRTPGPGANVFWKHGTSPSNGGEAHGAANRFSRHRGHVPA